MKFLWTEKKKNKQRRARHQHSAEGLFGYDSEELFSDVGEFNGSHSASVNAHRPGYLLPFPVPFPFRKDLAALALQR